MATRFCRSEKYRRRPRDVRRCLVHAANNRGREGEGSDAAARKGTGNADAVIGALFLCHKATNSRVMSAMGQKQTFRYVWPMSALPPKADIGTRSRDVHFVPIADIFVLLKDL